MPIPPGSNSMIGEIYDSKKISLLQKFVSSLLLPEVNPHVLNADCKTNQKNYLF